jgi:hypothetical protein
MKQSKQITLSLSDFATSAPDLKYSMRCKVISITYLGMRSINKEIGRILRRIEHWPQGSVQSFKILYQDAYGLGGEVKWDGEGGSRPVPRSYPASLYRRGDGAATRRSDGQGTARQPQARAPKQFALNRPAYSEE